MAKRPSDEMIELVAETIAATPALGNHGHGTPAWTVKAATRVLAALDEAGYRPRRKRRFHWLHDWSKWERGEGDWVRPSGRRFTTEIQFRECVHCGKEQVRRLTE